MPLFAERLRRSCQHARHPEGLGQVPRDAEVDRFDGAGLVGEAGDDDDREVGLETARLPDDRQAVDAGCSEWVVKPLDTRSLIPKLLELCRSRVRES